VADTANIFKAYDIRGKVGSELTPKVVKDVGRAFADWLPADGPVIVGRDMRPDSAQLSDAFMDGLRMQGRDVWDAGLVTSDMVYFAVGKYGLAGGAVITASHNPGADNGIKLYRDKVVAVGLDSGLDKIRDLVLNKKFKTAPNLGSLSPKDIIQDWISHCLSFITEIKPFHIAIDAGNGMAGMILPHILTILPVEADEMYFDLDGRFPNHEANPQKPENLKALIDKVRLNKLDFGIAFDGDGDRAGFVDDKGRPVLGTDLISIAAKHYLNKYPGSEIIHDVRTSRATQELIKEWGGRPYRTKAGRVVIGTVMRERKAPFGGETTGHLFFKGNYFADSGLIAALVVMQAISTSGKQLSQIIDEYRRYFMIPEMNFKTINKIGAIAKLKEAFKDGEQDELDGLTVNYADIWFNIRVSNTESLLRLNAEAKSKDELDKLVGKITKIITSSN
jgi:phosphomannomutase